MGYNRAKKKMKKVFMLVLSIAAIGLMASSCNKSSICKCTEYYHNNYEDTYMFDTEGEGVKNCSQMEERLNIRYGGGGYTYKCSKL